MTYTIFVHLNYSLQALYCSASSHFHPILPCAFCFRLFHVMHSLCPADLERHFAEMGRE